MKQQPLLASEQSGIQFQNPITFKAYRNSKQVNLLINGSTINLGNQNINLNDAIGLIKLKQQSTEQLLKYAIYSFPLTKKFMRKQRRCLKKSEFEIKDYAGWENVQKNIICRINNRRPEQSLKLLICFNPNAGANSQKHLDCINQFISHTNLIPQIFETQYRNHCLAHLKTIDARQYCGVAIVSGDGLMHQYVNSFCNIPVTHVPAGSGNAFAKTQMQIAQQQCRDQQSIFLVVKNKTKQFNIVKYQLQKLQIPIYSFLALQWAIIADLDMNSQFLRCLGGFRFQVYAAWRVLSMKRYRGKITYSAIQKQLPPLHVAIPEDDKDYTSITDTFLHTIFCSIPYISDKYKIAPSVKVEQRLMDLQMLNSQDGRMQLIKYLLNSDSGSHFDVQNNKPSQGFQYTHGKVKSFRLQPLDPQQMGVFGIDGQRYQSQKIQASFDSRTFRAFV